MVRSAGEAQLHETVRAQVQLGHEVLTRLMMPPDPSPDPMFPADWTRTALIFALLLQTFGYVCHALAQHDDASAGFLNFALVVSLGLAVIPFFFTNGPWPTRLRYVFNGFLFWFFFTLFVSVFAILFLGFPLAS
jgi:hypothetical protein